MLSIVRLSELFTIKTLLTEPIICKVGTCFKAGKCNLRSSIFLLYFPSIAFTEVMMSSSDGSEAVSKSAA